MIGVLIVTLIALFLSIFLVLINHFLNKKDQRVEDVLALLPDYNCGACGFPGCHELANQIVNHNEDPKKCKPIREEQYNNIIKYLESKKNN